MSVVAKTGDGRDWLAELRGAKDIETFKDLVMEVAVARPELRASVCDLARKVGGEELEDWVARFFILSEPQPLKHNISEKPSSIVSWPSGLRRPLLAQNPPSGLAANLNAVLASKAKAAAPKPAPKPEPEPEPASPAEPEPARTMLPVVVVPPPLPPPPTPNWDDAIAAINEQHAIIENVGGKTLIASWEPSSLDLERSMVVFQSKDSFLLRYSNRFVSVEAPDGRGGSHWTRAPLGQWWLGHRNRRQYRGVTFRPGSPKVVNECLNLWQGWGVTAKPGDWNLIREHIELVLAGGNKEFADYIIRWIAWAIQNPAAQAEVALVLIGEKGTGKGTLVRCLARIFGAHAFQVTSREEVIGKFNGHLQDCVLFIADEAYWGGDKRCVGRLQGMITETTLPIERKGIDLVQVPNYLHVLMLAEPGWVIPAGRFERRYAALAVSDSRRGDRAYFKSLHGQINKDGAEALMWDLQEMDLVGWHPRDIPEALLKNSALQEQQALTLPPLEQWYVTLLHNGRLPCALAKRPNTAYTWAMLDNARELVPRLRWDLSAVGLRDFLLDQKRIGIACTKYRESGANGWSFPPLTECREAWQRLYGPKKWDNPDAKDWGG
jgi:hypothetical protein